MKTPHSGSEPSEASGATSKETVLAVSDVCKYFELRKSGDTSRRVVAVDRVSLEIGAEETVGLVGESGCGKSTLARVIVGLYRPTEGRVRLRDSDVHAAGRSGARGALQMVFQDPAGSLNPRLRVWSSVAEPLRARGERRDARQRSIDMLERVGLPADLGDRYPHQLSGGQQQRACIARALIADPELVVFDEAISSLDVSLQAQVIALIADLQRQLGTTYLFITHDLARAMEISDRIAIMYLGRLVEVMPATEFLRPLHPYAKALIDATPSVTTGSQRRAPLLIGDVPNAANLPTGCRFHPRCPHARDICRSQEPELTEHHVGHAVACHLADEINRPGYQLLTGAESP